MLVVRTAQQADPVGFVSTRSREAVPMIEFEGARLGAPATVFVGEGAATAVPLEDRALDRVGLPTPSPSESARDASTAGQAWLVTLRMTVGTSGLGASRATSSSICRVGLPAASAKTSAWFSAFKCGASKRNPVMCTRPPRTASKIAGRRRAARARVIRL
jgi:hypothetical protein